MMTIQSRPLVAELLGTAILVATVIGSGIMAQRLTDDIAVALLANTLATGAILIVLISIFAPLSGAHFNPAVTLVMALKRRLTVPTASLYIVAQTIGAVFGAMLAHMMFDLPLVSTYAGERTGAGQWLSEAIATCGLVLTVLLSLSRPVEQIALRVGLYITAAYWFTASTSYANPAVTIGRTLTESFSGIRIGDMPAFVIAQLGGALIAMVLAAWLLQPQTEPTS